MSDIGIVIAEQHAYANLDVQSKLLRAGETRKVRRIGSTKVIASDVRIIAATHRDLATEVNRGTFRSDLFYRLSVAKLSVPSLRERREDIPLLVEHFLRQLVATHGDPRLPDDFAARALRHAWPGNVRELRNAVERAVLLPNHPTLADAVTAASDLPAPRLVFEGPGIACRSRRSHPVSQQVALASCQGSRSRDPPSRVSSDHACCFDRRARRLFDT